MVMVKDSLLIGSLFTYLMKKWDTSISRRVCLRIWAAIVSSWFFVRITNTGVIMQKWHSSFYCSVVDKVLNFVPDRLNSVWKKDKGILKNSFVVAGFAYLGDHIYMVVAAFFGVMIVTPHELWNNAYAFIFMAGCLFLVWMSYMRSARRMLMSGISPYMPMMALIVLYAFITSYNIGDSVRFLLFHVTSMLIVLIIVNSIGTARQFYRFMLFILAAVTVAGMYGCYQSIVGVEIIENQVDLSLELNATMPGRIYSTFDNPNNFAELLALTIPFYFAMILNSRTFRMKFWLTAALIPPVIAIAATYSRSSWIGLSVALLVFVTILDKRILPVVILGGIAALPLLPQSIINRILTIGNLQDSSTSYRFRIYEAFFKMLKDYWLVGVGLGSDAVYDVIKTYPQMSNGYYPLHAHNNYVQLCGEMGILGSVGFLAVVINSIKHGIHSLKGASREMKHFVAAGVSALVGILVVSIAEYTWYYPRIMFMFWLIVAMIWAAARIAIAGRQEDLYD